MPKTATRSNQTLEKISDDRVREMLLLAERLRASHGSDLDDEAIMAVAETTGADPEYVRLAVQLIPEERPVGLVGRLRHFMLSLDPGVRRFVGGASLATVGALMATLSYRTGNPQEVFSILNVLVAGLAMVNIGLCRDARGASLTGAITGGMSIVAYSVFSAISELFGSNMPQFSLMWLFLAGTVGGALLGPVIQSIAIRLLNRAGIRQGSAERLELLEELHRLQDKLRSSTQSMTFVNIDIVGSTKMKDGVEMLAVEYTFAEFHKYVQTVTEKHGGKVHSTSGDGANLVFEHPTHAFNAAKNLQGGLIEFNRFRNKMGKPVTLRIGLHTGQVFAQDPNDVRTINFAQVIDIAAHLQDRCPPGGVAVSESAVAMLPGGRRAVGEEEVEADGERALVWRPRPAIEAAAPNFALPPAPPAPGN
ncbi:MAG: adenylate/guanylate cyclase domain-containing protein [Fimbriimonadaceae bacterium]